MLSFTLSDADGAVISSSYAYDSLNRIASATNNNITETYGYDNNGNMTNRTNPVISVRNQYNNANWQIRAQNIANDITNHIGYYNFDGTLARTNDTYNNSTNDRFVVDYTYDGLNRMVSENAQAKGSSTTPSHSDTYTFDDRGNRATLDNGNYSYDANNRLVSDPDNNEYYYYDNGNLCYDEIYIYEYDGFNRLKKVDDYNSFDTIATYTYNGDGQRITKTVDGVTTTYVWNGDHIVYETTGTTEQKYYYGATLYAMEDNSGNVYYYGKNIHGDVVDLYNSTGTAVSSYRYDAFGNQKRTNTADTNPFRYAGEYYDAETGLIYLRNRYYDTRTGRFITEDPTRDGLNWYVYANNNPIMYVDPNGESVMLVITIVGGAVIGGLISGAVNAGFQAYSKGWNNVNWKEVGIETAGGALSGALSGSGLGLGYVAGGNALIGAMTYTGTQVVNNEDITISGLLYNVGAGGISGALGGNSKGLITELTSIETTYHLAKSLGLQSGQEFNKALIKQTLGNSIVKNTISTALDNIVTSIGENLILQRGSSGANVKQLQSVLGVAQDGIFGPQTEAALEELQKKLGVTADGIYGPQTAGALAGIF